MSGTVSLVAAIFSAMRSMQDGDAERDFLARVRWQPKGHATDRREQNAREEDVHDKVEDAATNVNVNHEVGIGLVRASTSRP
jgi:hypothetical protein